MPVTVSGSTVPRRQLGRELRRLREHEARIAQVDAAAALECSVTRLWRLERGELAIRTVDVKAMCELYGADEQTTAALISIAPHTKAKGWWHDYAEIPPWFDLYVGLEEAACRLRDYQLVLVPGVLQTREYATAVFAADTEGVPREEIEGRVAVRLRRARLLTRLDPQAPEFDFVLDEAALRRPVGGPQVMAAQLRRIAEAAELPTSPYGSSRSARACPAGPFPTARSRCSTSRRGTSRQPSASRASPARSSSTSRPRALATPRPSTSCGRRRWTRPPPVTCS